MPINALDREAPSGGPPRSDGYLPHVDGLRALAVALVVIYHAWPTLIPGGFVGVDVFFVISGFIITRQLAGEMEESRFSYLAFLGRRIRRLVPAALVCTLLTTAAAVVILMPDALFKFSESLSAVWTMTANFFFYATSGYFDAPSAEAPLLHMWSLAVEDQFYLTWPLVLLLLTRRVLSRAWRVAAVLALGVLSLLHSQTSLSSDAALSFYFPSSRAFELLVGAALAIGFTGLAISGRRRLALLDSAGLLLILGSAFLIGPRTLFPGFAAVPVVAGSVLCIAARLYGPTPVSRLLSSRPFVLVGRMSYSIYLYHWPMLALATHWLGRPPDATEAGVLIAVALALAVLSWILVEQRLTRRLGLYEMTPVSLIKGTAAAATAIALLGGVGVAGRGWPERMDPAAYKVHVAATSANRLRSSCDGYELALRNDSYCTFGKPHAKGASYDIAIFGDSNADHFVPMIAELARDTGLSGRQVTQAACAALVGATGEGSDRQTCERYETTIVQFLDHNPGLKIAVLSSAWSSYGSVIATDPAQKAAPRRIPFSEIAQSTVELFRQRGIKVLVIGQVPHLTPFSLRCLTQAARDNKEESECTMARSLVDQQLDLSQNVFQAIDKADDDVSFLDMRALLCTDTLCSAFKDDVLLYRDGNHLNGIGSAYLARYASLPSLDKR